MRVHLVPNSHIDPVWQWDKYEGIDEVLATFSSVCERLSEYPDLTFSQTSLQFFAWVMQYDSALFERIQQYVNKGRWEITNGWWVEPDSNLPLEASFHKHAELGQAFAQKYFGVTVEVACLLDSFGHPATLPKILSETGFKYFIFCRPGEHEMTALPQDLFNWEYDGHSILTYRLRHHYLQYAGRMPPDLQEDFLRVKIDDPEYRKQPVNCYYFGVGDHGGGPAKAEIEYYNRFMADPQNDSMGYSTAAAFFSEAKALPDIPVYSGDLHMHAIGCYSIMRGVKQGVRQNEHLLQTTERALKMTGTEADLDDAWKSTLFTQFHDILPGSCSPLAEHQALADLGGAEVSARDTLYAALKPLSANTPVKAPAGEFRVFNTLPVEIRRPITLQTWVFNEAATVRDQDGNAIEIQEVLPNVRCAMRAWEFIDTLPAQGMQSYWFDADTPSVRPPAADICFTPAAEDARLTTPQVDLLRDGTILMNEAADADTRMLEAPIQFRVLADDTDTWGHDARVYDNIIDTFQLESAAVMEGPISKKLYHRFSWNHSTIDAIYSIYEGLSDIYLDVTVNWSEPHHMVKMEMHPNRCRYPDFTMDAPGGPVVRKADGGEMPLHHWVRIQDMSTLVFHNPRRDFGLIQDGAFACDCESGRLRITLVRSNIYCHHGVPLAPDNPQAYTDLGVHHFRFCLISEPALSVEDLTARTAAFMEPCTMIREGI
jgi:alpha-mannosidase